MGVIDFDALSDEDAQAFFDAYVAALPEKAAKLRAQVAVTGGPVDRLDATPGSLEPLWEWFLTWHDKGGPAEPVELPSWSTPDPPHLAGQRLTPATLQLVDRMAAYFAEVLQAQDPDSEWRILREPKRIQHADQNQPVLVVQGWEINVRRTARSGTCAVNGWTVPRSRPPWRHGCPDPRLTDRPRASYWPSRSLAPEERGVPAEEPYLKTASRHVPHLCATGRRGKALVGNSKVRFA